jgi:surface antigen
MMSPLRAALLGAALLTVSACVATAPTRGTLPDDTTLYTQLTQSDIERAGAVLQDTLETANNGVTGDWRNPETGHSGAITPVTTLQTDQGVFCRRYDETLRVAGRQETYRQTACRTDEGRWVWVDSV